MWRTFLGWFVVAHGLLTIMIWAPNPQGVDANAPMDTSHSWLLGDARTISLILAAIAGVVIAAGGVGFLTHQAWWAVTGMTGVRFRWSCSLCSSHRGGQPPSPSARHSSSPLPGPPSRPERASEIEMKASYRKHMRTATDPADGDSRRSTHDGRSRPSARAQLA